MILHRILCLDCEVIQGTNSIMLYDSEIFVAIVAK